MSEMSELKTSFNHWIKAKMQMGHRLNPTAVCALLGSFELLEKMATIDRVGPDEALAMTSDPPIEREDTLNAASSALLLLMVFLTGSKTEQQRIKLQFEAQRFIVSYAHRIQSAAKRSPEVL